MTTTRISTESFPVRWTDQYSKFRFHDQNRVLRDSSTGETMVRKELVESMKDQGYRVEAPIRAYLNDDGSMTIIDGHNRLVAAMSLGLPVAYVCFKRNGKTEWKPKDDSKWQRPWSLRQYINAFAQEGNQDYAELLHYSDQTGIGLMESCSMLYGQSAGSGNAVKLAKAGTFKIKDRTHAAIIADMVATCGLFIDWATNRTLVAALSACLFADGFSPVQLKEKIEKHPQLLQKQPTLEATIGMLDTIYNRNVPIRNRYELAVKVRNAMRERQSLRKSH